MLGTERIATGKTEIEGDREMIGREIREEAEMKMVIGIGEKKILMTPGKREGICKLLTTGKYIGQGICEVWDCQWV